MGFLDAIEFAKFLQTQNLLENWTRGIERLEKARLEFGGIGKTLIIRMFDFDVRDFPQNQKGAQTDLKRRKTFEIWLRLGKKRKHFIF